MIWLIVVAVFIIVFIAALNTDVSAKSKTKSDKDLEDLMKRLHPEDFSGQSTSDDDEKELAEIDQKIADIKHQMSEVIKDGVSITVETPPMTECHMMFDLKGLYYRSEEEQRVADSLKSHDKLKLVPEPDNPKDKFAIKVMTMDDVHIGYVPADFCQKLSRNLQFLKECYVYNKGFYDVPYFNIGIVVVGKSEFYWEKYFMAKETFYEYKDKYDELKCNLYALHEHDIDEYLRLWRDLYDSHHGDDYLEFKYIEALYDHGDYELVVDMAPKFRDRLKLYDFPHLRHWLEYAPIKLEQKKYAEAYEKYSNIYKEGYELLKSKEYEPALQKFLECLDSPYHVQALPKNICLCYIKLKMIPHLLQFAQMMMDESWVSETTQATLQKHIDKYSDKKE